MKLPTTPMQAMMDGMSARWQQERSESQMTLGKLIERLESLPPVTLIGLGKPHSYRGYLRQRDERETTN